MSSLQALVESIVTDLIKVRFEADMKAAELAEIYRDHPTLRQLNVPTLNISRVSVELRVAFDDTTIEDPSGPTEEQSQAISEAARALRSNLSTFTSANEQVTVARQRSTLLNKIQSVAVSSATANIKALPKNRREAIDNAVSDQFTRNGVKLSSADRQRLKAELDSFEVRIAAAPKAAPKVPSVLVGSTALAGVDPTTVSSVKFDVDLSDARWVDMDTGTGHPASVLTDK